MVYQGAVSFEGAGAAKADGVHPGKLDEGDEKSDRPDGHDHANDPPTGDDRDVVERMDNGDVALESHGEDVEHRRHRYEPVHDHGVNAQVVVEQRVTCDVERNTQKTHEHVGERETRQQRVRLRTKLALAPERHQDQKIDTDDENAQNYQATVVDRLEIIPTSRDPGPGRRWHAGVIGHRAVSLRWARAKSTL